MTTTTTPRITPNYGDLSIDLLSQELQRFFTLGVQLEETTGQLAMMPSSVLDTFWHDLIKNGQIDAFTDAAGLPRIEHVENGGHDPLNWLEAYHVQYGKLPSAWLYGTDGVLDEDMWQRYCAYYDKARVEGFEMSWDCGPTTNCQSRKATDGKPTMSWDCTPKVK